MGRTSAKRAKSTPSFDKYDLYQRSVQSPDCEVAFFDRAFRNAYGRKPLVLREDFCGTAAVCCEWVRNRKDRTALGVDLDPEPLEWCREHNFPNLSPAALERVELAEKDARWRGGPKADVVAAQNFSWFCFTERQELKEYLRAAYNNLEDEGIIVMDIMGGYESQDDDNEADISEHDGFEHMFKLESFDPITNGCVYTIGFRFPDGTTVDKLWTYKWRHWSLPETADILKEVGFSRTEVYWEGTDHETGEGNGVYIRRKHAEADPAWVSYLIGVK